MKKELLKIPSEFGLRAENATEFIVWRVKLGNVVDESCKVMRSLVAVITPFLVLGIVNFFEMLIQLQDVRILLGTMIAGPLITLPRCGLIELRYSIRNLSFGQFVFFRYLQILWLLCVKTP